MLHFDGARLLPNSVRNAVWHALNEPVCQYLRMRNLRCSTVYIDNSLGPLARDSPCITCKVIVIKLIVMHFFYSLLLPRLHLMMFPTEILRNLTVFSYVLGLVLQNLCGLTSEFGCGTGSLQLPMVRANNRLQSSRADSPSSSPETSTSHTRQDNAAINRVISLGK